MFEVNKAIAEVLLTAIDLGYDVYDVMPLVKGIKNEDDYYLLKKKILNGDYDKKFIKREVYYMEVSPRYVKGLINSAHGKTKNNYLISIERKLKNIQ